jgi:hypothetical protein
MLLDYHSDMEPRRAISPVTVSDNTAQVSQIIDLQAVAYLEFVLSTASLADADATFTVLVEHGDQANLSDAAAAPDSDLLGLEADASFTFAADDSVRSIGYRGAKRYVRLTVTPALNALGATFGAVALCGRKKVGSL